MNKTDKSLDRLRKKNKDSNKQNQKSRGNIRAHATVIKKDYETAISNFMTIN